MLRQCHLDQRKRNGENDLRIKFDNGIPKVITANPKNEKPHHISIISLFPKYTCIFVVIIISLKYLEKMTTKDYCLRIFL